MTKPNRIPLAGAPGGLGILLRKEIASMAKLLCLTDRLGMGDAACNEEMVLCDLSDNGVVMGLTNNVDMVIHMGGMGKENTFGAIVQSNYAGSYNLYEGCRENDAKRVIWGSSNYTIRFYPRTQRIDASVIIRPNSNYDVSRVFGEGMAQWHWDKYGLENVSIHICSYSPKPKDWCMLTTWISYPDFVHLMECCLIAPRVEHTII